MGTLPDALPADTFIDGEWVNVVKWYRRVFVVANAIRDALVPLNLLWVATISVGRSIPDSTWQPLNMDAILIDTLSLGIDSGGFRCPADGVYSISVLVAFGTSNAAGHRRIVQPLINGGTPDSSGQQTQGPMSGGPSCIVGPPQLYQLSYGDLVEAGGWQDSGVTFTTGTGLSERPTLSIRRMT